MSRYEAHLNTMFVFPGLAGLSVAGTIQKSRKNNYEHKTQ